MNTCEWIAGHRRGLDVAAAVGFVVLDTGLTLSGASWWPHHPGPLAWSLLGAQALACAAVGVRRWHPMAVVAVLGAFVAALSLAVALGELRPASSFTVWAPYATVIAAYAPVGVCRTRPTLLAVTALTVLVARPWDGSALVIGVGVLRTAIGPLLALYLDARRRLVQGLTERAERAEREQHLLAQQARIEERARLAAEMHDVVSHRVSLMVLQAGALQVTAVDEATRRAADELRATGCLALDELRDLIAILGATPAPDAADPAPGPVEPRTLELDRLVAEFRGVGLPVSLTRDGEPAVASPAVARIAYQVVREALTNVSKHAPGATVRVHIGYDATAVRVRVRNGRPGRPVDPALAGTGSGLGLAGLRQRVELMRGTLQAGPTGDGGFAVEAVLLAYVPSATPVGHA